jgi:hypothetical protein
MTKHKTTNMNADAPPQPPRFAPKNTKRPVRAHALSSLRLGLRLSPVVSCWGRLTGVVKPRSLCLVLSNQPNFWDLKIGPAYG